MTFHQISKDAQGRSCIYDPNALHLALVSFAMLETQGYEPHLAVGVHEYTVSAEGILPITYIKQ